MDSTKRQVCLNVESWGTKKRDYYLLKEHMFDIILSEDSIFESEKLDKDSAVSIKETAEKEGGRNVQRKNFKSDN